MPLSSGCSYSFGLDGRDEEGKRLASACMPRLICRADFEHLPDPLFSARHLRSGRSDNEVEILGQGHGQHLSTSEILIDEWVLVHHLARIIDWVPAKDTVVSCTAVVRHHNVKMIC